MAVMLLLEGFTRGLEATPGYGCGRCGAEIMRATQTKGVSCMACVPI